MSKYCHLIVTSPKLQDIWLKGFVDANRQLEIGGDGGAPYAIPASNPFATNAPCVQGFGNAHCFNPSTGCATSFRDPITEYGHSLGASITGGYVYRGTAIPDLVGWYVFADFISGRLFAIPEDSVAGVTPVELSATGLSIASLGEATDGELYIVHYGGTIHQITAAP